jgi:hypothetical protein
MGKKSVLVSLFAFLFGIAPLLNRLSNPRLEGLHGSNFVQLIACGLLFGLGLGFMLGGTWFSSGKQS